MNLQDLLVALPPVGGLFSLCCHCDLRYETAWFERARGHCFFCHRFRTPRITRFALLRETEWFFVQSGRDEEDKRAFYEAYFFYLHRWADRFCFDRTQEEADYQEELLRGLVGDS